MMKIREALGEAAVSTLRSAEIGFVDSQIISENAARPTSNSAWAQLWFKPGKAQVFTLGSGGLDLLSGVFLVNIHLPLDTGNSVGVKAVDTFRKSFIAGKRLIFEEQETHITECDANLGRIVDTWYRADISIYWKAYLTRGVV